MKRPIINEELHKKIQDFANKNTNGNFTEAVSILLRSALFANKMLDRKAGKETA